MELTDLMIGPTEEEIINNLAGQPDKLLLFASKESSTICAEAALNAGASAKAKHQALISASKVGNLAIVQLLLEHGVNIHAKKDEAMREAAYHGQLEVIKLLVANGANIHVQDELALTYAATCHSNNRLVVGVNPNQGNLDVVKHLIENGADIELARRIHSRWKNIMDKIIIEYLRQLGYTF